CRSTIDTALQMTYVRFNRRPVNLGPVGQLASVGRFNDEHCLTSPPVRVGASPSLSLAPARSQHPFGWGQCCSPYPSHYRMAFASSGLLYPLSPPPSLRLGYHHRVGPVGLTQLTSGKPRMQEDGTCSPVGVSSIVRGA